MSKESVNSSKTPTKKTNFNREKFVQECERWAQERRATRGKNLEAEKTRPGVSYFQSLDSSVKKNNALVKRLRTFAELPSDQKAKLLPDIEKQNLRRYVSELVKAMVPPSDEASGSGAAASSSNETLVQDEDIYVFSLICSRLHQLYDEFTVEFISALTKYHVKSGSEQQNVDMNRLRVTLHLLAEMFILGIIGDNQHLLNILKTVIVPREQSERRLHSLAALMNLLLSFLKYHGDEYCAPLTNSTLLEAMDEEERIRHEYKPFTKAGEDCIVGADDQAKLKDLIGTLVKQACITLFKDHAELKRREEEKHQEIFGREEEANAACYVPSLPSATGSNIADNTGANYEKMRKKWLKLYQMTRHLALYLDKPLPPKVEECAAHINETSAQQTGVGNGVTNAENHQGAPFLAEQVSELLYDNNETRQFYEQIPDTQKLMEQSPQQAQFAQQQANVAHTSQLPSSPAALQGGSQPSTQQQAFMDQLLKELATCHSQSLVNQWVVHFVASSCINHKLLRKKLVKELFGVSRTQLELLPHYSRLVAIIAPLNKDVGQNLVQMLVEQFTQLFNEKDQIKIETKIKNIRFLSELTKFQLCTGKQMLECLDQLLSDFTHHNIEVTCHAIDLCGRYLLMKRETHAAMKQLLEKMMRLRTIKSLDAKYDAMVEHAYNEACKSLRVLQQSSVTQSVSNMKQQSSELDPVLAALLPSDQVQQYLFYQRYIYHLLYSADDIRNNPANVLKQLRKLPWKESPTLAAAPKDSDHNIPIPPYNPIITEIVLQAIRNIHLCKYGNVEHVASVVTGLARNYEHIGIAVVDRLLEDIRFGLRYPTLVSFQKRVIDLTFLGELYTYQLLELPLMFETLFTIILYNVPQEFYQTGSLTTEPDSDPNDDDAPFRIRLVCLLLNIIGKYIEKGETTRRRLDRILLYLQRFVLSIRRRLTVDVEYMLADMLDEIRPKLRWPKSVQEVCEKIEKIELIEEKLPNFQPLPSLRSVFPIERPRAAYSGQSTLAAQQFVDDFEERQEKQASHVFVDQEQEALRRQVEQRKKQEANEMDAELNSMISESLQQSRGRSAKSLPIRMQQPVTTLHHSPPPHTSNDEEQQTIKFTLLMRKGRQKTKETIDIPSDAPIALKTRGASL